MDNEILKILRDATITKLNDKYILKLQCGKLERDIYKKVNTCIERIGGKWKGGKTQGHILLTNPSENIQAIIESGIMPSDNPLAYYPTPITLCEDIVKLAGLPRYRATILEPSAGQGAICNAISQSYIDKNSSDYILHACELDPLNQTILANNNINIVATDFLNYKPELKYDVIIMNPPFVVDGDNGADMTHIYHAWSLLADNGVLVSITNGGWENKEQSKYVSFREFLSDKITSYVYIDGDTFENTKIATRLIRLDKNNWRLNEHNGWGSHYAWEYVVMATSYEYTSKLYHSNIDISDLDKQLRSIWSNKHRYYCPLSQKDKEEIEKCRHEK